jgi:hypothetical protein
VGGVTTARLQLRRAAPADLGEVLALLAAAAEDMHRRGFTAWPRAGFPASRIGPTVQDGSCWVLTGPRRPRPLGTVTLDTRLDPEFTAGGHDPCGSALIVHRMARCPRHPGGLGTLMLDFAVDTAARARFSEVWLNVSRNAPALQGWYLRYGFTHMDTVTLPGRQSGWLARIPAHRVPGLRGRVQTPDDGLV